jgi:hypothetical protein
MKHGVAERAFGQYRMHLDIEPRFKGSEQRNGSCLALCIALRVAEVPDLSLDPVEFFDEP